MPSDQQKGAHAHSIALIDMGQALQTVMRVIAANIQAVLEVPVDTPAAMAIPVEAFQHHRSQYDAGLVLKYLAQFSFPDHSRILAVTDVDLCTPILTYVFGQAELGRRMAVVSNFRLKSGEDGTVVSKGVYYERMAKIALHELAHTFSLYHCETPKCLMQITPRVTQLDELDIIFCDRCKFMLRRNMRQPASGSPD